MNDDVSPNFAEAPDHELAAVAEWQTRITNARRHWEDDHKRVRDCMKFVQSIQWPDQSKPDTELYVANMILRMVSQKVATLYAKNPTAVFDTRPHLYFSIWDEKQESLEYAVMQLQAGQINPAAQLLIADYLNGRNFRNLVDRVGKTLETLFNLQCDVQDFNFKLAMKQLVRRTLITGVGYVKLDYERSNSPTPNTQNAETRLRQLRADAEKLKLGEFDMASAEFDRTQTLTEGVIKDYLGSASPTNERLVMSFPCSLSVIVDPRCTNFVGFQNASWVAIEHRMTVNDANAFFDLEGEKRLTASSVDAACADSNPIVRIYELFDKTTESQAFFADGGREWLQVPTPMPFKLRGFWPIASLVFNNLEVEERSTDFNLTCWPLSDVFLWKSPQTEWNKRRNSLARHRVGASPKIVTTKNALTPEDKRRLEYVDPDAGITVVELEGLPPDGDINRILQVVNHPAISSDLYSTDMLQQDMTMTVGEQTADLGAPRPGETATGQTIAAHAKSVNASSNVDDLDDLLTWIAQNGGDILLSQMPADVVQELVGPGAVWPQTGAERFSAVVYLKVQAASSGRPNKALELQNVRELFPILMQLGANPAFLVRRALRAYDENINPDEAFPLLPPDMGRPQTGMLQKGMNPDVPQPTGAADQPPPDLPFGSSVPTVVN